MKGEQGRGSGVGGGVGQRGEKGRKKERRRRKKGGVWEAAQECCLALVYQYMCMCTCLSVCLSVWMHVCIAVLDICAGCSTLGFFHHELDDGGGGIHSPTMAEFTQLLDNPTPDQLKAHSHASEVLTWKSTFFFLSFSFFLPFFLRFFLLLTLWLFFRCTCSGLPMSCPGHANHT